MLTNILRRTTLMKFFEMINAFNAVAGIVLILAASLQLKANLKKQFRAE